MATASAPATWAFDPWVESWPLAQPGPELGAALIALADELGLVALDSCGGRPAHFDLLAFDPVERLEGYTALSELRPPDRLLAPAPWLPGPFQGGYLLALSYDLGAASAGIPEPRLPRPAPAIVGGVYTDWLCWHRCLGLLTLTWNRARADWRERRARVRAKLERAAAAARPKASLGAVQRAVEPCLHQARIAELIEQIRAGEVYQANLAHAFSASARGQPLGLYLELRAANPAPYGAFLQFPGGAILSSSPELLLAFDGQRARTRPIKGTAPRHADPAADAASAAALLSSIKDLAELTMIVDLARNDLGQVCEPGSVRVPGFPLLESYRAVHHLVAEVEGRPRAGVSALRLLEALFPGASITGAPKRAAMQQIARLEGRGRGFFCGALGFIDARGRAQFSILIRTLIWRQLGGAQACVEFQVGGGITIRSDPQAEEAETLDKARALLAAMEACGHGT